MATASIVKKAVERVAKSNDMTVDTVLSEIENRNPQVVAAVQMIIELEEMK